MVSITKQSVPIWIENQHCVALLISLPSEDRIVWQTKPQEDTEHVCFNQAFDNQLCKYKRLTDCNRDSISMSQVFFTI